jgi:hypothetical protein
MGGPRDLWNRKPEKAVETTAEKSDDTKSTRMYGQITYTKEMKSK